MSTIVVRYKLFFEAGSGYPPYFPDPEVHFASGIVLDTTGWYYGYLTAVDPESLIPAMSKWSMEVSALPLGPLKTAKITAIDNRTIELLAAGFTFDSKQFSMSESGQRTWVSLGTALSLGMLTFPMTIMTNDELPYVVSSNVVLMQFLGAYMLFQSDPNGTLGRGRVLKARVQLATTLAELEAIVDDR